MDCERLYQHLPLALQNIAVSVEGWRIARLRYNSYFKKQLSQALAREKYNSQRMEEYRRTRLREFIRHAATQVPYYRQLFRELKICANDIVTLDDLKKLPILTKAKVRSNPAQFVPDNISSLTPMRAHTSGTTGAGLKFFVTRKAHREQWATWWRYRKAHGIGLKEWCAYFGGRAIVPIGQPAPPYWRVNYPGRQVLFSGYHLGPATALSYIQHLQKLSLRWIHGYPSLLSLLAFYILQWNIKITKIKWVTIGAESLLPHQAETIFRAFGVTPIQHYGMAEGVSNISECPGNQLHVDEDFSIVEFVLFQNNVYSIIGTNYLNPAFPLIRYDTGDTAILGENTCSCGRQGRIIRSIDGRVEDYLVAKDGSLLGRMDHLFKNLTHIQEAQIVQNKPGRAILRIVRAPKYSPQDEKELRASITKYVGDKIEIAIQYVEQIEKTAIGKLRLVVSTTSKRASCQNEAR